MTNTCRSHLVMARLLCAKQPVSGLAQPFAIPAWNGRLRSGPSCLVQIWTLETRAQLTVVSSSSLASRGQSRKGLEIQRFVGHSFSFWRRTGWLGSHSLCLNAFKYSILLLTRLASLSSRLRLEPLQSYILPSGLLGLPSKPLPLCPILSYPIPSLTA